MATSQASKTLVVERVVCSKSENVVISGVVGRRDVVFTRGWRNGTAEEELKFLPISVSSEGWDTGMSWKLRTQGFVLKIESKLYLIRVFLQFSGSHKS